MKIIALGLNHRTAPIAIRERLAFSADDVLKALENFKAKFPFAELAILSTCNRVELYCATQHTENDITADDLIQFLCEQRDVPVEDFREFLYIRFDDEAVTHLLTVSSSLDSMVVGEPQIIAQVKESYRLASEAKSTGKILNRLFHVAFTTSKEIYSSTTITNRRVGVAGVAIELAKQLFDDISSAKVLVIGAGQMGQLLIEYLLQVKCKDITVINRSYKTAVALARQHHIDHADWERINELLLSSEIVVASAAVEDYLFTKNNFREIAKKRRKRALLIIDIAVPRNFAPDVNDIRDVYLYSVDDLAEVVNSNIKLREGEMDRAVEIICERAADFMDWLNSMQIGPLVGQLKERFQCIRQNELDGFFIGPRADASCKPQMETMVAKLVNKLLHCVIKNLNTVAKEQGPEQTEKLLSDMVAHARQIADDSNSKIQREVKDIEQRHKDKSVTPARLLGKHDKMQS